MRREAVAYVSSAHHVSERRACRVLGVERSLVRYSFMRPPDTELRGRLKSLAAERRRFGYRRLEIFLRREGFACNIKKIRRIYREENLMVKREGSSRIGGKIITMFGPIVPWGIPRRKNLWQNLPQKIRGNAP